MILGDVWGAEEQIVEGSLFGAVSLEHDLASTLLTDLFVHRHVQVVTALVAKEQSDGDASTAAGHPVSDEKHNV